MSKEQRVVGGVASTKCPLFHLIPLEALEGLADRFEQGVERKGDKAWNATSANQGCLTRKDFLLDRISHLIHHAMKFRDQVVRGVSLGEESMYENAGAVAFGGALLLCAAKKLEPAVPEAVSQSGLSVESIKASVNRSVAEIREAVRQTDSMDNWTLKQGLTYPTVGGTSTGCLIEFHGSSFPADKPPQFFSKHRSDVAWLWDGTPLKINMSLTDAEVEKFRIAYGACGSVG